jgi:predicted RNase H-like nuclease
VGVSKEHPFSFLGIMFISFAPPKEMNQRKGGRKSQLQHFPAPATLALLALRKVLKFAPFPVCPRAFWFCLKLV